MTCKPGTEESFKEASLANARESVKEPGIARFDIMQDSSDPCKFVLVEVFKNDDAPIEHKKTDHYLTWRDTVADMMAEPRTAVKYTNIFPSTASGWDHDNVNTLE